jgi:PhzF family phenazine biosynthesis protein
MKLRRFKQVDVFTATPYLGNPLAVVLDGSELPDVAMQHFAQWTNLSETAFIFPPSAEGAAAGADYRVRIFTPTTELPFAGHPTLGSCHAWLEAGSCSMLVKPLITQECAIGLVKIRREGTRLAFAAPTLQRSAPDPILLAKVTQALGLQPHQIMAAQVLNNGPTWFGLLLDNAETVLQLNPDHQQLKDLGQKVGVAALEHEHPATHLITRSNREARAFSPRSTQQHLTGTPPEMEVRAFAAALGVNEDPVTGSLNASLAQWLIADGHMPSAYIASQGLNLGRAGRVHIERDNTGQVWVGGNAITCIDGTVTL